MNEEHNHGEHEHSDEEISVEELAHSNNIILNTLIDLLVEKNLISEDELKEKLDKLQEELSKEQEAEISD